MSRGPISMRPFLHVLRVDEQDVVDQVELLEQHGADEAVEVRAGDEAVLGARQWILRACLRIPSAPAPGTDASDGRSRTGGDRAGRDAGRDARRGRSAEALAPGAQRPAKRAGRFSRNAATPSAKSSVADRLPLQPALEVELRLEAVGRALLVQPPGQAERDGRSVGEGAREGARGRHQAGVVDDAVDQPHSSAVGRAASRRAATARGRGRGRPSLGSSQLAPQSGTRPMRRNACRKYADSAATISRPSSRGLMPAPAAGPLTAATIGHSRSRSRRSTGGTASRAWRPRGGCARHRCGVGAAATCRFAPVQNARPAPVSSTQRAPFAGSSIASSARRAPTASRRQRVQHLGVVQRQRRAPSSRARRDAFEVVQGGGHGARAMVTGTRRCYRRPPRRGRPGGAARNAGARPRRPAVRWAHGARLPDRLPAVVRPDRLELVRRFAYALVLPAMRTDLALDWSSAGWLNTANAIGYLGGALLARMLVRRTGNRTLFASAWWSPRPRCSPTGLGPRRGRAVARARAVGGRRRDGVRLRRRAVGQRLSRPAAGARRRRSRSSSPAAAPG